MQRRDGRLLFSPSDLTEFMESPFASWMTRRSIEHPQVERGVDASDPEAVPGVEELLKTRGLDHEARVLAAIEREARTVVRIEAHAHDGSERTRQAMESGVDVVYQAHLARDPFAGIADFVVRIPGESDLGAFRYEVWDAKLARRAKPTHILQLCAYAEMLESTQGVRPAEVQLVLGDGRDARFRIDDFFYFYRSLQSAFLDFMSAWNPERPPPPEPGAEHHRWQEAAEQWLEERDHVSRVAFSTRIQVQRLAGVGIDTMEKLASTSLARVRGIEDRVFLRLREQAVLQRASANLTVPRHRILPSDEVEEGKGLTQLPPASPGDIVLDLEGDPLQDHGLEYLWGMAHDEGGAISYRAWWAHDARAERGAVESALDWITERRRVHPDLHVYHYGSYEVAALRRLAGREATREEALDVLLRAGVFVDLYPIVRHGLRVGEPSYSLKNVERLYRPPRAGGVATGMESVVVYEAWRQSGEPADADVSPLLAGIRAYNEEDCRSTSELVQWLRAKQAEAHIPYRPRSNGGDAEEPREEREDSKARRELAERMLAAIPESAEEREKNKERWAVQALLAELLEFHRREARPVFWELYDRAAMDEDERAEQPDCLSGLRRTARPSFPIKRSRGFEYEFDPEQDTKIGIGDQCKLAQATQAVVTVEEMDPHSKRIVLKISAAGLTKAGLDDLPDDLCLILWDHRRTDVLEEAIERTAEAFQTTGNIAPALRDLLLRRMPRIHGHESGPIRSAEEGLDAAFLRAARGLDSSTLCVQGPPGSGKTTKSGHAIAALVREGCRVGVASQSHKAIAQLMRACADASGGRIDCLKVGGEEADAPDFPGVRFAKDASTASASLGRVRLIGGTAWCFSHSDFEGLLDYLFIDEAGQVSLANAVAMSRSARNLVLIGDQMQLSQPTRGSHPGESGLSALEHALAGHVTIPAERGLFLEETHRLHPELCSFVSGAFYDDQLHPTPRNELRALVRDTGRNGGRLTDICSGLAFVPVAHEGNRQGSDEEVAVTRDLIQELLARTHTDRTGASAGRLRLEDILVVAPYNLQVRKLLGCLPEARIGTVDRFQGQEAPVVIVSMCASEPHLSARGIQFLFHPNRLNVALSRAQCLAIVVGEPRLATANCRSVEEMRLVNRVCRLLQVARRVGRS